MIRRLIAALAALLLAGVGAVLLLGYVAAADRRAMAGMETVQVLVVTKPVAEGTPAAKLTGSVTTKVLPATAVAPDALSSLGTVGGRVTGADLLPGEQLIDGRFVDPASLVENEAVKVPTGLQQLSFALEAQRVLGGELTPGATVGVFVSLPAEGERPPQTKLVLHTTGQGGAPGPTEGEPAADAAAPPAESLTVTLALSTPDAELVVFGLEHAKVWLSLEPANAETAGGRTVDDQEVYAR